MKKKLCLRLITLLLVATLILPLSSCGALLYPERHGQTKGELDTGVLVLDGIGLLFFLIPGVIAFAVDFSGGYIYLPGGYEKDAASSKRVKTALIRLPLDSLTRENIESVLTEATGQSIDLMQPDIQIYPISSPEAFALEAAL